MGENKTAAGRIPDHEYKLDVYSVLSDVMSQWISVLLLTASVTMLAYIGLSIRYRPAYRATATVAIENINEDTFNTTKFAVLSRNRNAKKNDTSLILMFAVKNEAGMLAKAIDVIGRHGFSMNALRSRHLKSLSWQYYFYAEIEGDPESDEISRMLSEMSQYCVSLKQLGTTGENPNELI